VSIGGRGGQWASHSTGGDDTVLERRGVTVLPDFWLNSGGVIVSYFERLKNLSHVRFGRLARRMDERRGKAIVRALLSFDDAPLQEAQTAAEGLPHGEADEWTEPDAARLIDFVL
jgi:glutamate dehydrogenase/leucine dehydrogenase